MQTTIGHLSVYIMSHPLAGHQWFNIAMAVSRAWSLDDGLFTEDKQCTQSPKGCDISNGIDIPPDYVSFI